MHTNLIREYREKMGLNQSQLAILLRIPQPLLSDLELGKQKTWPRVRKDLCKIFRTTTDELFQKEGDK